MVSTCWSVVLAVVLLGTFTKAHVTVQLFIALTIPPAMNGFFFVLFFVFCRQMKQGVGLAMERLGLSRLI